MERGSSGRFGAIRTKYLPKCVHNPNQTGCWPQFVQRIQTTTPMTIKILGSDRGSAEGRRRCVTLGRALIVLLLSPCLAIYGNAQTQFQVLHAFGSGIDGEALWSAVIFDTQGSIYGTANAGGAYGTGTVYELVRSENGEWTENVLHSFDGYPMDGMFP
jgi:hypothetical protein